MDNSDSLTQRLSSRQCTEQSTRKGVSDTVRIDNLFVLESVDSVRLDVIGTVGADNNVCTVSKHDNTIPGGVGLWLGEGLNDGREIIGVGGTVRARPSFRFGLVVGRIINMGGAEH